MTTASEDAALEDITLGAGRLQWLGVALSLAALFAIVVFKLGALSSVVWLLFCFVNLLGVACRGLELRKSTFRETGIFSQPAIAWTDCTEFVVVKFGGVRYVAFTDMSGRFRTSLDSFLKTPPLASCKNLLTNRFGMNADDLATLMNRYRQRAFAEMTLHQAPHSESGQRRL